MTPDALMCEMSVGCQSCVLRHERAGPAYAYLLGQYLGDGHIVRARNRVFRLTISCTASYPLIVEECVDALSTVFPSNRIGRRARSGVIDLSCYSNHVPCSFPQHGPGKKHERAIVLEPWQHRIAIATWPDRFVRGLIHSDGCRSINSVVAPTGKRYAYPRYTFSNRSREIRELFCDVCEALGIEWRQMNRYNISVARRSSVAILDELVGPKR